MLDLHGKGEKQKAWILGEAAPATQFARSAGKRCSDEQATSTEAILPAHSWRRLMAA
jgi:hypothetical protein